MSRISRFCRSTRSELRAGYTVYSNSLLAMWAAALFYPCPKLWLIELRLNSRAPTAFDLPHSKWTLTSIAPQVLRFNLPLNAPDCQYPQFAPPISTKTATISYTRTPVQAMQAMWVSIFYLLHFLSLNIRSQDAIQNDEPLGEEKRSEKLVSGILFTKYIRLGFAVQTPEACVPFW